MGFIYLVHAVSTNRYKIGFSLTGGAKRLRELQTGSPYQLELLTERPGDLTDERKLHRVLWKYRQHGEWFEFPDSKTAIRLFRRQKRSKEQIIQDRQDRFLNRVLQKAEMIAAETYAILMMVTPRQARKYYVNNSCKQFDTLFWPLAYESLETGKQPNYQAIAWMLRGGEVGFGDAWKKEFTPVSKQIQ